MSDDNEINVEAPVKEAMSEREWFRCSSTLKDRIVRATAKLAAANHADITRDGYIRGAVEKRNAEILDGAA